jgi:NTE family protein
MEGEMTSDSPLAIEAEPGEPQDALALCLSGGGYRAMLFHLGALWYLNDAGYLPKLDRVSSVSGGSIAAGVLATRWSDLAFDAAGRSPVFADVVGAPVRRLAGTTIDAPAITAHLFQPSVSVNELITKSYAELLFGAATLQDLPDRPRFVINATNVQTGVLFRYSKPYLADYRVGRVLSPRRSVAEAVAVSSACPPWLSPAALDFSREVWTDLVTSDCGRPPFTTALVLTDGGIYDNLGLETAWKSCRRLLVSDGGGHYQPEERPASDPFGHGNRILDITDNQVRSLRKRQLIAALQDPGDGHSGAYWGTFTDPGAYPVSSALPVDPARARELALTPTRLAELPHETQDRLVNFGYAMAERAVRSHYDPAALAADGFPCPGGV